jgi:excinuclease ABC subunit B
MPQFQVVSPFKPMGDQPQAIQQLVEGVHQGKRYQTLLGATGTGKTFTMAHVIAQVQRPTLIISHNKTLAAQLFEEMKELFPHNAVGYFVSYYDYYQPEAYIPQRDIYIEKDSSRNDDLDRLRLAATSNLVSRRDTIIVASVSCIFGLGSPEQYRDNVCPISKKVACDRDEIVKKLISLQYSRNDLDFKRGTLRARGDVLEIYPSYEEFAYRVELFGDEISTIDAINPVSGEVLGSFDEIFIYPAVHYVLPEERMASALANIREELDARVMQFRSEGKLLEAQRLLARTKYDLELLEETGVCQGIENYSRHMDGRKPGEKPYTLIDYFAKDYLLIVDESHVSLSQFKAMYTGDQMRKQVLVDHGFRLPSALDNRPLKYEEFEQMWNQIVFVSATPSPVELEYCKGEVAEQVIRPTGLLDPVVEVHSAQGQVPHMLEEIKQRVAMGDRVLVTCLTKRLAEDLSAYIQNAGIKGRYLHSEIQTIERVEILNDLRKGEFDVLIGINLLREGLDLPEVSLVCILDADKTGFLRSGTSLIQTIGRAARNANSKVILYADSITPAMRQAMDETDRRRAKQIEYNKQNGITPQTIKKAIREGIDSELRARKTVQEAIHANDTQYDKTEIIRVMEEEMLEAAQNLEFERAAQLRDRINQMKGAPDLKTSGGVAILEADEAPKIWQPKSKGKKKKGKF